MDTLYYAIYFQDIQYFMFTLGHFQTFLTIFTLKLNFGTPYLGNQSRYLKIDAQDFRQYSREYPYQISALYMFWFFWKQNISKVGVFCVLVKKGQKIKNSQNFQYFVPSVKFQLIFRYIGGVNFQVGGTSSSKYTRFEVV